MDRGLIDHLTAEKLGKRLAALWRHLGKGIRPMMETDRRGVTRFSHKLRL
jgi:hypothetical protein